MRFYSEELKLSYEKYEDHIVIVEGDHGIDKAIIPESIDDIAVTAIYKKAFLGCKLLRVVKIPDGVTSIGDFAFAMCDSLEQVSFPNADIKLGKSIFKNDNNLKRLMVRNEELDESRSESSANLMAAAPVIMDAEYIVDIVHAGSVDWFRLWDQKLFDILSRKDDEGYHLYVLCGEEDLHFDYDQYIEYIRQKKSGLCMLRLLYDANLEEASREKIISYLTGDLASTAITYVTKNHGEDKEYFDLLMDIMVITSDNNEEILSLLGDRYPQTKAYLIEQFASANNNNDYFDNLML